MDIYFWFVSETTGVEQTALLSHIHNSVKIRNVLLM